MVSFLIETFQLATETGLFEICDLINNTIGGIIGIELNYLWKSIKDR